MGLGGHCVPAPRSGHFQLVGAGRKPSLSLSAAGGNDADDDRGGHPNRVVLGEQQQQQQQQQQQLKPARQLYQRSQLRHPSRATPRRHWFFLFRVDLLQRHDDSDEPLDPAQQARGRRDGAMPVGHHGEPGQVWGREGRQNLFVRGSREFPAGRLFLRCRRIGVSPPPRGPNEKIVEAVGCSRTGNRNICVLMQSDPRHIIAWYHY
mmetsp:Transcript_32339/g.76056  ORF Transcript_32339/g.76056 Transcript_32339/m.76056 type:complete len:206 (-) Transcript_32339:33-650(-)